ncbi:MAG: sensor histidine kinase, partial [Clostridiales bacterium]|nr:sensor histidine kinase [Clostridiales bacterium]
ADVIDSHEPQLQEKNINLQVDLVPDDDSLVIGNDEAIQRVIVNMLGNAIRFCPLNGEIKISSHITDSKLYQFVIEDNGRGLSDEDLEYVFDRFYKADKARNSEGSGLGLFIARNIIQAHGQMIEADNSMMGGAMFSFTLATP